MGRGASIAICLVTILAACSDGGGGPATSSVGEAQLRAELETRGHTVVPIGTSESRLTVDPQWWCVSGVVVGVYEYRSDERAANDVARVEEPAFSSTGDLLAPPSYYAGGRLIVEALGAHDALGPDLLEVLGSQLTAGGFAFAPTLACEDFRA